MAIHQRDPKRSRRSSTAVIAFIGLLLAASSATASEPVTDTVGNAAERMLAAMPADFFTIKPVPASEEIESESPLVLDVREPDEFSVDRIAGAKNVPLRSFVASMASLPSDRTTPMLVYCKSGHRGAMATTLLHMHGYSDVRSIYGGLVGWKAADSLW